MTHAPAVTGLVDLNEIAKIELLVLRRLASGVTGDHRSRADGTGFDFVGLRDWQAGDRFSAIDWAQSSLTNFAPLVVREFDQPSTATVLAVADASLSTRCGAGGVPLAAVVARALATIGLSAAFFQDRFGLLTFDRGFAAVAGVAARTGRGHVVHCLEAYESRRGLEPVRGRRRSRRGGGRQPADDRPRAGHFRLPLRRRARRRARAVAGQRHPRRVPGAGRQRLGVCDRGALVGLGHRARRRDAARRASSRVVPTARSPTEAADWQARVARAARDAELDVVVLGVDERQGELALAEFVAERRLRRVAR